MKPSRKPGRLVCLYLTNVPSEKPPSLLSFACPGCDSAQICHMGESKILQDANRPPASAAALTININWRVLLLRQTVHRFQRYISAPGDMPHPVFLGRPDVDQDRTRCFPAFRNTFINIRPLQPCPETQMLRSSFIITISSPSDSPVLPFSFLRFTVIIRYSPIFVIIPSTVTPGCVT